MTAATTLRPGPHPAPTPKLPPSDPLSRRWLGLDWSAHLPWRVGSCTVELATLEETLDFVRTHYPTIFDTAADRGRWLDEGITPAKLAVFAESDRFAICDGDRMVGLMIAAPVDWSTYYLRSLALLDEYRGHRVAPELHRRLEGPLRAAGVRRIELDTAPANAASLAATAREGYLTTGMLTSERWGTILRRTKYLDSGAQEVFLDQYCAGIWPRYRAAKSQGAEGSSS